MSQNMQNMQTICSRDIEIGKICKIICRICKKICKMICRIVTGLYSAYSIFICRI
jgi:hypothetical protein